MDVLLKRFAILRLGRMLEWNAWMWWQRVLH